MYHNGISPTKLIFLTKVPAVPSKEFHVKFLFQTLTCKNKFINFLSKIMSIDKTFFTTQTTQFIAKFLG